MLGMISMMSRNPTVVTLDSLRNQFDDQEFKLEKASGSRLTMNRSVTLSLCAMLVFSVQAKNASCQNSMAHPSMSASAVSTQQTLQAPFDQAIENEPLEKLLDNLSSAYELPIWCDRRIARDTLVTVERREETLESVLNRAAVQVDSILIPLAGVIMIVPKSRGDEIEASHWRLAISRSANAMKPIGTKPFGWPDGSVVSKIIHEFSTRCYPEHNLTIKTDHDIWRAFEFRKTTTPAAIGTCLLSGFDLSLSERDGKLAVTPIANVDCQVEWIYSRDEVEKKIGESAWKAWRQRWPDAKVAKSAKPEGWRVSATAACHRDLIGPMFPKKKWEKPMPSEVGLDRKVYSFSFEGELELLIKSLAAKTELEFFPLPLPASLESAKVKMKGDKTPLDDILKEITKQCGVRFRRDGKRVEIIP